LTIADSAASFLATFAPIWAKKWALILRPDLNGAKSGNKMGFALLNLSKIKQP
jgi:hypothetical protein